MSQGIFIGINPLPVVQESKWSIEEVNDSEDYIPEKENEASEEKKEQCSCYFFVTFVDGEKLIKTYRGYLIHATNEDDFAKKLHSLIQQEKKLHGGKEVSFLDASGRDNDYYRIIIKCDQCAHCKFSIEVDETKCLCQLHTEEFLTLEQLLASECKNCGSSTEMRLNSQDSFSSCFQFQLTCNNDTALRTPTKAKICIQTLDSNGKIIWKDKRPFAVCFYNMDGRASTENKQKTCRQILEKNHENILAKMKGERQLIEILNQKKVLGDDFKVDSLSRKDLIGKLLRHLFISVDGLPQFINALRVTQLPQNLELADILFKDFKNSNNSEVL